ncbi:MAG: hypothetical protein PHW13_12745 [Methylococcales bacterium]|nr:hypothetical protein [Methylococcales bacterium]
MKYLVKAAVLAAMFTTGSASATETQFDFSYIFSSGDVITGNLMGNVDGTGNYIINISNVQATFDGVALLPDTGTGYLDAAAWNTTTGAWDNTIPAVVSFNAALNNFGFADVNLALNTSYSNGFAFVNDAVNVGGQLVFATDVNVTPNLNAEDATSLSTAGTWSLTAVPLPTSLPLMLSGLGLLAAAARRRLLA